MNLKNEAFPYESDDDSSSEWAQWWLQTDGLMDTGTTATVADAYLNDDFWFSPSPKECSMIENIEPMEKVLRKQIDQISCNEYLKKMYTELWPCPQERDLIVAPNSCNQRAPPHHVEPVITDTCHTQGHFLEYTGGNLSKISDDTKSGLLFNGVTASTWKNNRTSSLLAMPNGAPSFDTFGTHPGGSNLRAKSKTSYNFFFDHERHRVEEYLRETQETHHTPTKTKNTLETFFYTSIRYYSDRSIWSEDNVPLQEMILQHHWNQNRATRRKRKGEKGDIQYREMRQHISKVWRMMPSQAKGIFSLIAVKDLQHSLRAIRNSTK